MPHGRGRRWAGGSGHVLRPRPAPRDPGAARRRRAARRRPPPVARRAARRLRRRRRLLRHLRLPHHLATCCARSTAPAASRCGRSGSAARAASCRPRCSCSLCCALATLVLVPQVYWEQFLAEIRASTAYVQNWQLASSAVDYFAAEDGPSPVRHFWSLSVEEQFYLCWPVLLLAAARGGRRTLAALVVAVTAASLAWSLHLTAANPAAAYFVTPTRAWEFGAGALLAFAGTAPAHGARRRRSRRPASPSIALAAAALQRGDPFPGAAALLPVLGALAVIGAGVPLPGMCAAAGPVARRRLLLHLPLALAADRPRAVRVHLRHPGGSSSCSRSLPPGSRSNSSRTRCGSAARRPPAGRSRWWRRHRRRPRRLRRRLLLPARADPARRAGVRTGDRLTPGVLRRRRARSAAAVREPGAAPLRRADAAAGA